MLLSLALESESDRLDILVGDVHCEQERESPSGASAPRFLSVGQHLANASSSTSTVRGGTLPGGAARAAGGDRPRAADDFDVAGHGAPERLEIRLAGLARGRVPRGGRAALTNRRPALPPRRCANAILRSEKVDPSPPEIAEFSSLDSCQQAKRGLQITGIGLLPVFCRRGAGAPRARPGVSVAARSRKTATAASPPRARACPAGPPFGGDLLVGHGAPSVPDMPRAAIGVNPRIGGVRQGLAGQRGAPSAQLPDTPPSARVDDGNPTRAPSSSPCPLRRVPRPFPAAPAARHTGAGSPTGSAAATSNKKRRASPGSLASLRAKLSLETRGQGHLRRHGQTRLRAVSASTLPTARADSRGSRQRSAPARAHPDGSARPISNTRTRDAPGAPGQLRNSCERLPELARRATY